MAEWTIKLNAGTPQTAEAWGLKALKLRWVNQQADTLTMEVDGANVDASPAFAFGDTITLYKDAAQYFVGKVSRVPRAATGSAEGQGYEVRGPWWDLERMVYQQEWTTTNGSTSTLITANKGRVLIGRGLTGGSLSTQTLAQAVEDAVDWAQTNGANVQFGSFTAATTFPVIEAVDITVAEAIRRILKWTPDAVVNFDYSTSPPTLNVVRRSGGSTTTQALTDLEDLQLFSRDDLQVPAVVLKYEKTHNADDATWTTVETDKFPVAATGLELGALVLTIELSGSQTTSQKQRVETDTLDPSSTTWWAAKVPHLADVTGLTLGFYSTTSWPRELVEGAVPAWLDDGTRAERIKLAAKVSYTVTNSDGSEVEVKDELVAVNVVGTDLVTKTYQRTSSQTDAETAPVGLAEVVYNGLSTLAWEGRASLVAEEVATGIRPGRLLRITGGATAWATMDAQIQAVEEEIDDGTTGLEFGPAQQLAVQDLIELLRIHRGNPATWRLQERETGQPSQGGEVEGAGMTPIAGPSSSPVYRKLVLSDGTNTITIDPANGISVTDGTNTATIEADQVSVSDGNDTSNMTPTQVGVTDGAGNNAGMTKDALGIEAATGDVATLTPIDLEIDNGTGTGRVTATEVRVSVPLDSTAFIKKDQVGIESGAGTGTLFADRLSLSNGSETVDLDTNDLPTSGFAEFEELDYCDAGTAKTLYALSTVPAA